ncbi:MAG: hypothetical protein UY70_C0035G0002 [Candidatus Kaiserbacteria bacterium GW2011_GWB1_52_6]|uniref:Uncharacterized protein n=1 Tax=Candidatus Kaiserbacteria bacterium GW2011_GWB1_52_6 TaxID=1618674 RepID=A0A0G1X5R7_9BACT|nr:MAG: hypothetical protein UY70_C0035G0002 [Candidatus Kaiserbacteria bacterium GW2011_GWB1_52_6]
MKIAYECDHDGIVGGELGWWNKERWASFALERFGEATADMGIGRYAAADDDRVCPVFLYGPQCFFHQHLRGGIFEFARDTGLHFIGKWRVCLDYFSYGRLQTRKREVEIILPWPAGALPCPS